MDGRPLSAEPEQGTPATPASPRSFTIGQVLTLACARTDEQQSFCSYGDLLDVLGYMLGDVPAADDIPDAIEQCRPAVRQAYPELAAEIPPPLNAPDTAVLSWLSHQERQYGGELTLAPLQGSGE
uniref:Minor tail protein n=1 Tax=Mycobacterium phage JustASigh TaxID=3158894 RepID=A0AAU8GQU0_9CAUD